MIKEIVTDEETIAEDLAKEQIAYEVADPPEAAHRTTSARTRYQRTALISSPSETDQK
jgi:hypothetical protein